MHKIDNFYGMKKGFNLLFMLFLLSSCSEPVKNEVPLSGDFQTKPVVREALKAKIPENDWILHQKDTLVCVDHFNKAIWWELKYATNDNFMHRVLYDTLDKVYVQIEVARRLAKCQEYLTGRNPDYHLLVYDGLRPLSVQWEMWNALDTIPASERGKFVSNPRNGSVHNYGAAVDLTICTSGKKPLDMGAGYDDIRKIAYPSLESEFLASGELTEQQIDNRKLLRRTLTNQEFSNISTEWWHFNAFPRSAVKRKYQLVLTELK
jgi:D-alanyl-D-alanine dipeptidase